MHQAVLYAIVESPAHPDLSELYRQQGFVLHRFTSMRKAIAALKTTQPDVVVAEFFYGWGNNYAGVNISNLDVLLASLRKYAPKARIIVMAGGSDWPHIDKLRRLFTIHRALQQPVTTADMAEALAEGP
jgi:hypothetical protein